MQTAVLEPSSESGCCKLREIKDQMEAAAAQLPEWSKSYGEYSYIFLDNWKNTRFYRHKRVIIPKLLWRHASLASRAADLRFHHLRFWSSSRTGRVQWCVPCEQAEIFLAGLFMQTMTWCFWTLEHAQEYKSKKHLSTMHSTWTYQLHTVFFFHKPTLIPTKQSPNSLWHQWQWPGIQSCVRTA